MDITQLGLLFILTWFIFLAIDFLWLGVIAKSFYRKQLAGLLRDRFNIKPALVFYFIYITGLMFFVIYPAIDKESTLQTMSYGALFGLVAYATYDLSNLATLKNWPIKVVLADIIWGMFISGSVSAISVLIGNSLL